jgi:hypothetical protein
MRIFLCCLFFLMLPAYSSTSLNLELGQAINAYNKVRIDGESGTLFNLAPALESTGYYRLSLAHKFRSSSSGLRFLYAPLRFSGERRFSQSIDFNGVNFPETQKTKTDYQFNSYRATYFYQFLTRRNLLVRAGGTLKIRDALIKLRQDDREKFKKNVGVVPLLYFYGQYKGANGFLTTLDFDGLIAPQGRAFDVALMGGYAIGSFLQWHLGYRMLEGGADNDKVYNFSQVNYYFTALQLTF